LILCIHSFLDGRERERERERGREEEEGGGGGEEEEGVVESRKGKGEELSVN
jgi:hypothetical protein